MHDDDTLELARAFNALTDHLHASPEVDDVLRRLVELATKTVPDCRWASVGEMSGGLLRTAAASDDVAVRLDALHQAVGDGPGLSAITSDDIVVVDDLLTDTRWPAFCREAASCDGVRSVMSFRIARQRPSAFCLYSPVPAAFSVDYVAGSIFAAHTHAALVQADAERRALNLDVALDSNRRIGMALGILMHSYGITEEQAFATLKKASQDMNIKMRDIALKVASGEF
ncbi:MAG: ANTAR domain-containing protein [bacterium]